MANLVHTNLFLATVYKWQTGKPEGWNRVRDATNGTSYLLNTNRLCNMRDKTIGQSSGASLYFFDNPFDHRDNCHYMEISDHSVAQIVAHVDTSLTHKYLTLTAYGTTEGKPSMEVTSITASVSMPVGNFAFAVDVTDSYSGNHSYVYYVDRAWRFQRVRVAHSLAAILTLVA